MGNVLMDGGFTFLSGDGNVTMNIDGDYSVTGGTHDYCYSTGTTSINVSGDVSLNPGPIETTNIWALIKKSGMHLMHININGLISIKYQKLQIILKPQL